MIQQIRKFIGKVAHGIERAVRQPRSELDRWGHSVRFAYDLSRVGARQLTQDRAPEMAAALAFRTLFALAPVLVVVTILVRAVSGVDEFLKLSGQLLDAAGLGDVQLVFPVAGDAGQAARTETLKEWLAGVIEQTTHVTLPAVGWIGFAMIVYAAISLLSTIESSFNVIYRAPYGRPLTRSIPLYWFLLTVSPLAISVAAWLHAELDSFGASLAWSEWMAHWFGLTWNFLVTWLLLAMTFVLVPNTSVSVRAASAGAFVTVVLLEIGKRTIGSYLASSFGMSQLVTSLGLIPLFMFWVYLMWLAVLFGLQVSAILQQLGGRELEEMERAAESIGVADPSIVVTLMQEIARDFQRGQSSVTLELATRARLSERQLEQIVHRLIAAGLLHRVAGNEPRVCLAVPPRDIAAPQLLDIGFELADTGRVGETSPTVASLRAAQRERATSWTLETLVAG
jgi:membrane protein